MHSSSVREFCKKAADAGPIHALVHCAGAGAFGKIEELTEEDWDDAQSVAQTIAFTLTQPALVRIDQLVMHPVGQDAG